MMMRILEQGGLPVLTDGIRAADEDNPRGYYEFERVKRLDKDASWLPDAYNKALKVIYIFLYQLPPQHRYKVLFLRRDLDQVVASQNVMLGNRNEKRTLDDERLIHSYQQQLRHLEAWLKQQNNFEVLYLDYEDILSDPEDAVLGIVSFLGLRLNTQRMVQTIEPALHRNRSVV